MRESGHIKPDITSAVPSWFRSHLLPIMREQLVVGLCCRTLSIEVRTELVSVRFLATIIDALLHQGPCSNTYTVETFKGWRRVTRFVSSPHRLSSWVSCFPSPLSTVFPVSYWLPSHSWDYLCEQNTPASVMYVLSIVCRLNPLLILVSSMHSESRPPCPLDGPACPTTM